MENKISAYIYPGITFADSREWKYLQNKISSDYILKTVANVYDKPIGKILTNLKRYPEGEARNIIYFILSKKFALSQDMVGVIVCKKRSTISAGIRRIQKKLRSNKNTLDKLQQIEMKLLDYVRK